jgi:phage shock protein PspC (stress-responsive transcriptional regulator)
MFLDASAATAQTIALLVTFLGVGVVANVLIVYVIAEVMAERRQNQERREGGP